MTMQRRGMIDYILRGIGRDPSEYLRMTTIIIPKGVIA